MDYEDEFDEEYSKGTEYEESNHDTAKSGGMTKDNGPRRGLDPLDITDPVSAYLFHSDDVQDELQPNHKSRSKVEKEKRESKKNSNRETKIVCPKCGYTNESGSIECLKCGIVFFKYYTAKERKKRNKRDEKTGFAKNQCPKCKTPLEIVRPRNSEKDTYARCPKCKTDFISCKDEVDINTVDKGRSVIECAGVPMIEDGEAHINRQKYHLRTEPLAISEEQISAVFRIGENALPQEYIHNDLKDNGDGTITDYATGLMWQESGSKEDMSLDTLSLGEDETINKIYEPLREFDGFKQPIPRTIVCKEAKVYINKLNMERFGGHSDWRLPTVEELLSLLEPKGLKCNGTWWKLGEIADYIIGQLEVVDRYMYIHPLFDPEITRCLSADNVVDSYNINSVIIIFGPTDPGIRGSWGSGGHVRAVRSCYRHRKVLAERIIVPSINYEMVYIKRGTFMMGSPENEGGRTDYETLHPVTLTKGFYMGATVVTQAQWYDVMGYRPWRDELDLEQLEDELEMCNGFNNAKRIEQTINKLKENKHMVKDMKDWGKEEDDYPAVFVSWEACQIFIKKLNLREKTYKFRLPTEEEWEYSCRAGSQTRFCFGEDESTIVDYAWCVNNTIDNGEEYAHRVAQKRSNAWGLFDMHGNVEEWCHSSHKEKGEIGFPSKRLSIRRGGAWNDDALACRSAARFREIPSERKTNYIGFRIARTP